MVERRTPQSPPSTIVTFQFVKCQQQATPMPVYTIYCKNCGNGSPVCALRNCRHCRDRTTSTLPVTSPSPASPLGKRTASTQTDMDTTEKKKQRHSDIVANTVSAVMNDFYRQDNEALAAQSMEQAQNIRSLERALHMAQRRMQMFEIQLGAAYRYCAMVETWVPAVTEMFGGDFQDLMAIQADQRLEMDRRELESELADLTTEEEDSEEE